VHILFLSDNFPPEVNAPASRTFEHCREWVAAGHRVTVITCAPNFPRGKLYEGYRNRLFARETMDGIEVVRVWSYISANEGFFRRSLDYLSYMLSAILAAPFIRKVDIVVATSPQFFTACAGRVVGLMHGKPFVFELRDLWPESIRAVGAVKDGPLLHMLEALELSLYRGAAAIVTVTHAFRDKLIGRGVAAEKIQVVTNGADLSRFSPRPRDAALAAQLGLTGKFVAGYVGTHGMAHALETVLEAADRLRERPDIGFLFLGDGASKAALKARAKAMGLTSVVFVDSVAKDEVARYWSLLDASIIHLKRTELFTTVIPSKLFECMAMGLPVLHGVAGESADIVRREGCGEVFEPENADQLAQAILALLAAPERRAELAANGIAAATRYDRRALAARMLGVLEQTAGVGARKG
jgi:glycosyltransferase involved in cell wall biosynthesis